MDSSNKHISLLAKLSSCENSDSLPTLTLRRETSHTGSMCITSETPRTRSSKRRSSTIGLTMAAFVVGSILSSSGCRILDGVQDLQEEDNSSSSSHEFQDSQLRVLLTDAPLDVDHVYVTISEIRVHSCASEDEHDEETSVEDSSINNTNEEEDSSSVDDSNSTNSQDERTENESKLDEEDKETIREESEASEDEPIARRTVVSSTDEEKTEEESKDDDSEEEEESKGADCPQGKWLTVMEEEKTLDLLALQNGLTEEMGLAVLPAGNYGQIRLMLDEASVVVNGETFPLSIPSGVQSGIKIQHGFHLSAGQETVLTLDFDASQSVHHAPGKGWMMRPVIKVIDVEHESMSSTSESPSSKDSSENKNEESSKEENTSQPQDPGKEQP